MLLRDQIRASTKPGSLFSDIRRSYLKATGYSAASSFLCTVSLVCEVRYRMHTESLLRSMYANNKKLSTVAVHLAIASLQMGEHTSPHTLTQKLLKPEMSTVVASNRLKK